MILLPAAVLLASAFGLAFMGLRKRTSRFVRFIAGLAACLGAGSLCIVLGLGWFLFRPQPAASSREIFQGVELAVYPQREPWPAVFYVVAVDLQAPGIGFVVTPNDRSQGREFTGMTTSEFARRNGVQAAINGGFFEPWHSKTPWDYYPKPGDAVDVRGISASAGELTSGRSPGYRTLTIDADNTARIADGVTTGFNAISGLPILLDPAERNPLDRGTREPRTAVALDAEGRRLFLIVVDGRQPHYSEGATIRELAGFVRRIGGVAAINLDGGGSTALAIRNEEGGIALANVPIHTRIPYRERPVANHLGVYARPLGAGGQQ